MSNTTVRVFGIGLFTLAVWAQTGGKPRSFEVASIKPSRPDDSGSVILTTAGEGLNVANSTVRNLITFAYDIRGEQLSGGPAWLGTDHFDIIAKTARDDAAFGPAEPKSLTEAQRKTFSERVQERLRALLAERFGLVVHRESKELAVFFLVVAKGGPKVKAAAPDDTRQGMRGSGRGHTEGSGVTMERLTAYLGTISGRQVLDQTGLTGKFDWTLDWTPNSNVSGNDSDVTPQIGPTIFTAVQEQMGLKLEPGKRSIESVVIDRITHPTEN